MSLSQSLLHIVSSKKSAERFVGLFGEDRPSTSSPTYPSPAVFLHDATDIMI